MKYLLDTHVILWAVDDSNELSKTAKEILRNENALIFVSMASLWEFSIKYGMGKLKFNGGLFRLYENIKKADITIYPIIKSHLAAYIELPFIGDHKDPFDRLLVATAKAESMTILTADKNIHKYDVSFVW
jgi:PIN domain nuclease of toxin-antitoxin system